MPPVLLLWLRPWERKFMILQTFLKNTCGQTLRKKCTCSELFRIQSECKKIRTRIIPNTGTFHAVKPSGIFERFCLLFRNICYEEPALFNTLIFKPCQGFLKTNRKQLLCKMAVLKFNISVKSLKSS